MEVKTEKLKDSKEKLTIRISAKEMVDYFNKSFDKIAPTIKLDGFRSGKAPRKLIESAAGVSRLLSEALDLAVSESYTKALIEHKLIPITQPKIVINKYPNYGQTEEEIKEDFEFEMELEVLPEVTLGDYKKLKVEAGKPEVAKKEEVEKVLKHFQKQNATFNEKEGPAKKGDFVEISYEGFLKHVKIDQMCSKNHPIVLGEGNLIPGFEDEIIGLKKGDKKDFKIKFPKDYHAKEYADKEAEFKLEVVSVKEVVLPKLDDEFAVKFGHKDMEKLKAAILDNLNHEYEDKHQREVESKVIEKVLPLLKAEVPQTLIERETDRMIADFGSQIVAQGINFDKYLESIKKTREDLSREMAPAAEKNVKIGLLLGKIIEEKKWDQSDPEVGKKAMEYLVGELTK